MELLEETDLSELQEAVPELSVRDLLEKAMRGEEVFEDRDVRTFVSDWLEESINKVMPSLLRLCGYAILCIVLSLLSSEDGIGRMGQSLLHISALLLPAQEIVTLTENAAKTLDRVGALCNAVTPSVSALLLAEGSVRFSAGGQAIALFVMEKLIAGAQNVLLPLLKGAAVLILLSSVVQQFPLKGLCKIPLSFVKWSCGIAFAAFLGMLMMKGIPAARYDGVTVRAAKYAVEKLVPVVGGIFKETTDTLIGCVLLLKGALGTVAILGLLFLLLLPVAKIAVTMWGYRLLCALLEPMGESVLSQDLGLLCEVLLTLLIVLLTAGAILIVFLTALTMAGGLL